MEQVHDEPKFKWTQQRNSLSTELYTRNKCFFEQMSGGIISMDDHSWSKVYKKRDNSKYL